MKRIFVVTPFGNPDRGEIEASLFQEINGLYKHILKPAEKLCQERGVPVTIYDGRQLTMDGRVLDKTAEQIDLSDAVIVVLTADKPNVFIELGWSHAFWQDPILLIREGYNLPSDISNQLGIHYTPGQVSGKDRQGAKRTVERLVDNLIDRISRTRRRTNFPHLVDKTPLAIGELRAFSRFSKAISYADWSATLQDATEEIILACPKMSRINEQPFTWQGKGPDDVEDLKLTDFLVKKALGGVKVTVMMYPPEAYSAGHLKQLQGPESLEEMRKKIKDSYTIWATARLGFQTAMIKSGRTEDALTGFRLITIGQRYLPFRATLTENRVLLTLRFYTEPLNSGLFLDIRNNREKEDKNNLAPYQQVRKELDFLIKENLEASEVRYDAWRREQAA